MKKTLDGTMTLYLNPDQNKIASLSLTDGQVKEIVDNIIMDIPKVYKHAENAFDSGKNVTEAVKAYLDVIAKKV